MLFDNQYLFFSIQEVKQGLLAYFKAADTSGSCHIVMNLPAMAIEFLKHFHGLLDQVKNSV